MMSIKRAQTLEEVVNWLNYITLDEGHALQEIVQSLSDNPQTINIGAGAGTSGLAIMQARPDVYMTTVDITKKGNPFGCLDGELDVLNNANVNLERYSQIHGDSKVVEWDGPDLDFVFIDGDHSSAGVRGDIENWIPRIKKGGVIAFHDYKKTEVWRSKNPDREITPEIHKKEIKAWDEVDTAVDELMLSNYELVLHIDTLIAFRI